MQYLQMFFTLFREPLWGGVRIFASIEISIFVKTEFSCMITWLGLMLPCYNANSPGLTYIGPLLWQAKQTMSALCQLQPAT